MLLEGILCIPQRETLGVILCNVEYVPGTSESLGSLCVCVWPGKPYITKKAISKILILVGTFLGPHVKFMHFCSADE